MTNHEQTPAPDELQRPPAAANLTTEETHGPDIDARLEDSASLFELVENYWAEVQKIQKGIEALGEKRVVPASSHTTDKGVTRVEMTELTHGGRDMQRLADSRRINARLLIAQTNQKAFDDHSSVLEFFDRACDQFHFDGQTAHQFLDVFFGHTSQRIEERRAELAADPKFTPPPPRKVQFSGETMDQLTEARRRLSQAYLRAFFGQYIATKRLEELLADDALVGPFAERIAELATLDQDDVSEFPGLLETLAVHVAAADVASRGNLLKEALQRTARMAHTPAQFITSILVEGEVPLMPGKRQQQADFTASVIGAQALATILSTGEGHTITKEEIAARIAARFEEMPDDWHSAYSSSADSLALGVWKDLRELLRKHEHPGRLRSNIHNPKKPEQQPQQPQSGRSGRRGRGSRGNPSRVTPPSQEKKPAALDVNNVSSSRHEHAREPISSFGVLKGTTVSSVFALERAEGFEGLMTSQVIAKFLRSHPDLEPDVRSFLQQLTSDHRSSKVLHGRSYRIDHPDSDGRTYRLRSFSPRRTASESGARHQLADRVRIIFGVSMVGGAKHLVVHDIDLRDDQTY